jgi:diguanylate cyclase (GGDEF)-like protein
MGAIAAGGGMLRYDGLLLYVLGVHVLSGLTWRAALAMGAVIGAGWVLLVSSCALEREVMTTIYLVCANIVGLTRSRLTERLHRASFLRRVMVEQERQRVQILADALAVESLHDELTGLSNRRLLAQHGELLWEAARQGGRLVLVAMVDVDHFKAYNDRLGHPAGDQVLRQVGCALQSVASGDARQAFRYGGEEFTVLWAVDDPSEAAVLGRCLHAAVAALAIPHPSSSTTMLTVSVGLMAGSAAQASLSEALEQADSLLYEAKRAGRSRTQFGGVPLAPAG